MINVKTSNASWLSRPYSTGDGCAQGYNWQPTTSFTILSGNNYTLKPNTPTGCGGRAGYYLDTYPIGTAYLDFFINDTYYNIWDRYCAGLASSEYLRVYYR